MAVLSKFMKNLTMEGQCTEYSPQILLEVLKLKLGEMIGEDTSDWEGNYGSLCVDDTTATWSKEKYWFTSTEYEEFAAQVKSKDNYKPRTSDLTLWEFLQQLQELDEDHEVPPLAEESEEEIDEVD